MSLCDDCIQGVTHEGVPKGNFEKIGGVDCFVSIPDDKNYPKNKVILFLPDAFGIEFVNSQLLISDFARNGFKTVGIDYYQGDRYPPEAMEPTYTGPKLDLYEWAGKHGQDVTRPVIDKVVKALQEDGVTEFGATGYCFGGRYVFDLSFDNIVKASVASHPSLLKIPDDLEKYLSSSKSPLLINSCTIDRTFGPEAQTKADEILGDGKFAPGYKREYFDGCTHGFAVRGDLSDPKVKAGKEGSFRSAVKWFQTHL